MATFFQLKKKKAQKNEKKLIELNGNQVNTTGSENNTLCCHQKCIKDDENEIREILYSVKSKMLVHNLDVSSANLAQQVLRTISCNLSSKAKMKHDVNFYFFSSPLLFSSLYSHCKTSVKSCFIQSVFAITILVLAIIMYSQWDYIVENRCAISNNYIVMEVTRPVTNCDMCKNVHSFLILNNPTKEEFAKYAYSGQPMLVKSATNNWTALHTFSFDFFRHIYATIPGAHQSVEEECQFFPFKTNFLSLKDVFAMQQDRVNISSGRSDIKPWYIGWSNCNPDVANILRHHYQRPTFLPDDSESSAIDWIFMGYSEQGASMHLDYVQRPSWQAQISGSKSWHLLPPPECEMQCNAIDITVNKGEIILIDTNQWYHDTHINEGDISITIGSEYD